MYLSWKIQNDFIVIMSHQIREKFIEDVKKARIFSILADETSDVTNEQLSLVCYVCDNHDGTSVLKESFLGFSQAEDLGAQIIQLLTHRELELENIRRQGYDGAAAVAERFNGVEAVISRSTHQQSTFIVHAIT